MKTFYLYSLDSPLQLMFRGVSYPNNSVLSLNDIGDTSTGSAIICTTNGSPCCKTPPNRFGEWYYPDGSMVPNNATGKDFYRGRGDNQTIQLNRRNNAQSPTGSFCCELPDNSNVNHTLCVRLGTFCNMIKLICLYITPCTCNLQCPSPSLHLVSTLLVNSTN